MTHATMNKTAVTGMSDYDEGYDVGHDDGFKSGVREANRLERDLKMGEHWDECYLVHPVCAAELRVVKYGFIVAELIADLRAHHQGEPASGLLNGDGKIRCQTCVYQVCPCATAMHLDRAEARLREVQGE